MTAICSKIFEYCKMRQVNKKYMLKKNLLRVQLLSAIIFFSLTTTFSAQDPESYNRIYSKTFLETSQRDSKKALQTADSLYLVSETPKFKTKSLMLSATLLQQSGELKKAIDYALKAEEIVQASNEYLWQAKVNGFISSQYRNLGLYEQSKKYIDKSLLSIKKLEDPIAINSMTGLVMQEKAYYEIEFKNYSKAINLIHKSQNHFRLAGSKEVFFTANNLQLEGLCYLKLDKVSEAHDKYEKAKKILDQLPDNFLKGLVYSGLAQVHIRTKDLIRAKEYLDKAEKIADESNYLNLKNEIYTTSQDYYIATKNIDKYKEIKDKKDSTLQKISQITTAFIDKKYTDLETRNKVMEEESLDKSFFMIFIFSLMIISGIAFMIWKKKYQVKAEVEDHFKVKDKSLINNDKGMQTEESSIIKKDNSKEEEKETEQSSMMTPATEQKLLAKLDKFEKSKLYTKNTVSLPYLASYCDTNTKYLSYIINHYKEKDFNNYINELRINYIIDKLNTDPKYLKYKIASLAEESGFSSQSKFAIAFKKLTNVSPSHYLQNLKNDRNK